MSFWIRHTVLLLLCVLVPFTAALYQDTESRVERAKESSRRSLHLAVRSLPLILQNEAHRSVSAAMSTAQRAVIDNRYSALRRGGTKGAAAAQELLQLLNDATPRKGFAWLADADGRIILANGQTAVDERPRVVRGHPVFIETQLGYALDGIWSAHQALYQVAGAPLVDGDKIVGAVLIGRQVDEQVLGQWAETLSCKITLAAADKSVMVSSAATPLAQSFVDAAFDAVSPVYAGQRETPLTDGSFSFLPMLVDHRSADEAFVSAGTPVVGATTGYQWVISIDATDGLSDLAARQSAILGSLVASFLLALLVGILNYRSYVAPNDQIAEHLSELQMGKGDIELPETSVARPFRRLVRLINMTVQKIPNRSLALPTADLSSITRAPPPVATVPADALPLGVDALRGLRDEARRHAQDDGRAAPEDPLGAASHEDALRESLLAEAPQGAEPLDALGVDDQAIMASEPLESRAVADDLGLGPFAQMRNGNGASGTAQFDNAEETEAAQAATLAFQSQRPLELSGREMPAEDAIAEAIAQLEGAPEIVPEDVASRRSAADIRGRPMGAGGTREMVPFEDVSVPPSGPMPGVRGGGSLDLGQGAALPDVSGDEPRPVFGPEETVVAPVASELLARSARDDLTGRHHVSPEEDRPADATVVANVPADLLAQSASGTQTKATAPPRAASIQLPSSLDPEDRAHFKEVYDRFIDLRRRCGESTADLAFDRFLAKLSRNRENLVKKYNCRTVRFQVYKKDGKAALKATPVGTNR